MADPHGRYEQLAVGHVLGGLGTADAAEFRAHLLECSVCRTRVAELRDIAADLEAAERDELQRSRVQTQLPRRAPAVGAGSTGPPTGPITVRHVTLAAILVMVLAGAMAFWNLHLRTSVAAHSTVADRHAETLRELATGVVVPASFAEHLSGVVVVDEDRVAFSLAGVEDVGHGDSLVAWLLDGDGGATTDTTLLARPGQLDEGLLTDTFEIGDAEQFVVTRESGRLGPAPDGEVLLRADLVAADP